MATIAPAPARAAPALTWDIADGIATVVLDLKDHPVNVLSRAVKDEFIACFAALESALTAAAALTAASRLALPRSSSLPPGAGAFAPEQCRCCPVPESRLAARTRGQSINQY